MFPQGFSGMTAEPTEGGCIILNNGSKTELRKHADRLGLGGYPLELEAVYEQFMEILFEDEEE